MKQLARLKDVRKCHRGQVAASIMLEREQSIKRVAKKEKLGYLVNFLCHGTKHQVAHGFSPGDGFLASSMSPDIFLRKRLCMFFSSMFLSLSPVGALHLA